MQLPLAGTSKVAVPSAETEALVQLPPMREKLLPVGHWSLPPTGLVWPGWPGVRATASSTASIITASAVVVLLLALPSLVAPVVPVKVTGVATSSLPPWVKGAV